MLTYVGVLGALGDERFWTMPAEVLALLEPLPPGPELVEALFVVAGSEAGQGRTSAALAFAERGLDLTQRLGLGGSVDAVRVRGLTRLMVGDPGGVADLLQAIALATEAGQGSEVCLLHQNLAVTLHSERGPEAALDMHVPGSLSLSHGALTAGSTC